MKKIMILLIIMVVLPIFVFAHGGHRQRNSHHGHQINYPLCNFRDCYAQAIHQHNGTYFSPHYYGDGHSYHQQCSVTGCNYTIVHTHNGHHFFPKNHH